MTGTLLLLFGCVCAAGLLMPLASRGGIYQYPFLAAGVFTGFVLIQLLGLANNPRLPQQALDKTILMAILCLLMVYVGAGLGGKPIAGKAWRYDTNRLLIGGAVLSAIGAFFFFQINRLPAEMTASAQWSGTVVAYRFFASTLTYGFAIATLVYFINGSKFALGIMLFDLAFYLDRIFVSARRGDAIVLLAILVLSVWFTKRIAVPRTLALAALCAATLFLYSTGDYRRVAVDKTFVDAISEVEFKRNFHGVWRHGGAELENAVYQLEAIDRFGELDWGAFHWNALVFNYVPAQWFGREFKDSLMIDIRDPTYREFGFRPITGTTPTGLVDAFRSFWYFGAVKFLLIAYVLARMYRSASQGSVTWQLLYMLMITNGLHAITHHTGWFVSPWIHLLLFLGPVLWFAHSPARSPRSAGRRLPMRYGGSVE